MFRLFPFDFDRAAFGSPHCDQIPPSGSSLRKRPGSNGVAGAD